MSAVRGTVAGGVSLTTIVVLIAANGERFAASLKAGWEFLILVASKTPLGLGAFLLSWVLGAFLMGFLRRWLPEMARRDLMHWRMAFIELVSALAAFSVCYAQIPTMLGLIFGTIAGLSVSIIYRIGAAIGGLIVRKFSDERQPTEP